jgi:hemin uptake protein HemP
MVRDGEKTADGTPVVVAMADARSASRDLRRWLSSDLLDGGREAIIAHGRDEYRLRMTSNGKLILTK